MRGYWRKVGRRAWRDMLEAMGWGSWAKFLVRIALVFGAFFATLFLNEPAADKLDLAIVSVFFTLILGAVVFLIYLIFTPHKLDTETLATLSQCQARLRKWDDQLNVGRRLECLWRQGQELLRNASQAADWKIMVVEWFGQVHNSERENLPPNEQFLLETHTEIPRMNVSTTDFVIAIQTQNAKLRLLVDRLLTPPKA